MSLRLRFLALFVLLALSAFAALNSDTTRVSFVELQPDTLQLVQQPTESETPVVRSTWFERNRGDIVWFAAVVPGLGQICNRQYWKLPIVYGGAMGVAYAISWNHTKYADYRKAYIDLSDGDPTTQYYNKVLPKGVVMDDSNKDYYTRVIKDNVSTYRRYRDLSILCGCVLYVLTLIDAYVDAQLADYDIGPDLSVKVAPAVLPPSAHREVDTSVGLKCRLRF